MKKISIFGSANQEGFLEGVSTLITVLKDEGYVVEIESAFRDYLAQSGISVEGTLKSENLSADAFMVISIGGDGTFLRAAEWAGSSEIPIMGINTGHLGYLAGFKLDELPEILQTLSVGGEVTWRMQLEIDGYCVPDGFLRTALNEIAVSKGDTVHMVNVKANIDGYYLADYLCDGLVISTPTGSTAYNLSAGGPILQPTLDGIVLSPVAPHSLAMRPLVIDAGSVIELEVSSRGKECHIALDGRLFSVPASGSKISVRKAPYRVGVVMPKGKDFSSVLRNKLLWGTSNR